MLQNTVAEVLGNVGGQAERRFLDRSPQRGEYGCIFTNRPSILVAG